MHTHTHIQPPTHPHTRTHTHRPMFAEIQVVPSVLVAGGKKAEGQMALLPSTQGTHHPVGEPAYTDHRERSRFILYFDIFLSYWNLQYALLVVYDKFMGGVEYVPRCNQMNIYVNCNREEQTTILLHIVQVPMVAQSSYDILHSKCATEKHFCMRWLKSSDVMPFFQSRSIHVLNLCIIIKFICSSYT